MDELKKLERLERGLWTRINSLESRIDLLETSQHAMAIDLGTVISEDADFDTKVMEILQDQQGAIKTLDAKIHKLRANQKSSEDGPIRKNLMEVFVETDMVFRMRHITEGYCKKHNIVYGGRPMMDVISEVMGVDGNAFFEEINQVLFGEDVPTYIVDRLEELRIMGVPSEDLIQKTPTDEGSGGDGGGDGGGGGPVIH